MRHETKRDINKKIKILFFLDGGVGDSIVVLAWIKEFHKQIEGDFEIDITGNSSLLFSSYMHPHVHAFIDKNDAANRGIEYSYDAYIRVTNIPILVLYNEQSIKARNLELGKSLDNLGAFNKKYKKFVDGTVSLHNSWTRYCEYRGWNYWDMLGINGAIDFSRDNQGTMHLDMDGFPKIEALGFLDKQFITVHSGSDAVSKYTNSVKQWPKERWEEFCKKIKSIYPDLLLVQVGADNSQIIDGVDINLVGKTSLHDVAIILKHSLLHVDGDSGLVHLRIQLSGKSIVLFGPTPKSFYGYSANINIVSSYCKECLWILNDWFDTCAKGFEYPKCMEEIKTETVLSEAVNALEEATSRNAAYSMRDASLYTSRSLSDYRASLYNICDTCGAEAAPASEHIYGPARTYIHASKQWEYPYALEQIEKLGGKGCAIADIGGGRGMLGPYLAKKGYRANVFDIDYRWDDGGVADIEKQYIRHAGELGLKVEFGSVFNIPCADESFDLVTCISVIEHVIAKKYALREMLRIVKPGGFLIMTFDFCAREYENDGSRIEVYTNSLLAESLRGIGIDVDSVYQESAVASSLEDIARDRVNIAPGLTVGGMVIQKVLRKSTPLRRREFGDMSSLCGALHNEVMSP